MFKGSVRERRRNQGEGFCCVFNEEKGCNESPEKDFRCVSKRRDPLEERKREKAESVECEVVKGLKGVVCGGNERFFPVGLKKCPERDDESLKIRGSPTLLVGEDKREGSSELAMWRLRLSSTFDVAPRSF
ncbi:hypothetical protein COLO4_37551 [Corchorus olitorius]|uniref:Uncharacterized protein n=1 Tax=Corchorus olitorius TaxID=93759 RepID=A0A1R3G0W7_9ROSI|nr:hypothetical protein COLO4_37551 [Corchorus olitorius]